MFEKFRRKISAIYLKRKILFHYRNVQEPEISELIGNLRKIGLRPFLGNFITKYDNFRTPVYRESCEGNFWVIHNGEKLFFPKETSAEIVEIMYMKLCREQDMESPHRYVENYDDLNDCYLVEAGAAEASFSLDAVRRAKKVYICECSPGWIEPLKKTFEPYKEKVQIIQKYVAQADSEKSVTIDTIIEQAVKEDGLCYESDKIFIKMDIEGMEEEAISGMKEVMRKAKNISLVICAYHKQDAEKRIRSLFSDEMWEISTSKSYMLFPYEKKQKPPYFRRGVLRITKRNMD